MVRTILLACMASWLLAAPASAQSVARTDSGLTLQTTGNNVLTIDLVSERAAHVRFGPRGFTGNYNPAVIASPAHVEFKLSETPDAVTLATSAFQVRVKRASAEVAFLTADGKPLLEEAGRDLSHGVSQTFSRPNGGETVLYGLGQHQNGLLDYNGVTVRLQQANRDVGVPMMASPDGFGLLWNNAAVTEVDVALPTKPPLVIRSEAGGGVDYHFIYGPDLDTVIGGYRALTGDAPMMARWTWGLWQSKERYATQDELLSVAARYRAMNAPFDAVVQDWQYWRPGQWGSHRFDPARFPDPAAMVKTLHDQNVHTVISVWARFDLGTDNTAELDKAGALYPKTYPNVYPAGQGRWYDAYDPKARALYWRQVMRELGTKDFDGWWLDASEAELGGNWGQMREVTTAAGPGAAVYNAYPLLHTTAVHEGMLRDQPTKRPFILTRSAYAGQQRNAAITWSGDTTGTWDVLRRQIPAALNFSLSGIPYWSADIGGFFGGDPKDPAYAELFTRWYQFGVFNPMFRVHGTGKGKELWAFDEATQKILLDFDRLRYRLLPYIYSASWDVTSQRSTMMRALAFDFRDDPEALRIPDQYMFGKALLVAPVVQAKATARTVYLPGKDAWYDFWTGQKATGGQVVVAGADLSRIPLFVRAGSILPLGPVKPYADAPSSEPIELVVYPGRD
ncbi:MAG TPA: TIM-barrel domain-containing protein, partial [Caulobacter sp.]|nr:TIM-barrel domain-containing protein [Caulobacter sp.]